MRRILITVNNHAYFRRMLELAVQLSRDGHFSPCLYLHDLRRHPALLADCIEQCARAGIEVVPAELRAVRAPSRGRRRPRHCSPDILGPLVTLAATLVRTLRLIQVIRREIREREVRLVVMPEDSPDYGGPAICRAAHDERVPVAVLGAIGYAPASELARIFRYAPELAGKGLAHALARRLAPKWAREHEGVSILRSPVSTILVQEALGIAAPEPWVYYSGSADSILVDSEAVRESCVGEGLDPTRIRVTGFVEDDLLREGLREAPARREQLARELGIPGDGPILLLALVQAHYVHGAPRCDFAEHGPMVEFIVKTAASTGLRVVVSLHPSMSREDYGYIEEWGVKIAAWPTPRLIPLCDVFVASGSSTIGWAVACGKPVINYDVYRYGLRAFAEARGLVTVQEKDEFRAQVAAVADPEERQRRSALQTACSGRWGKLDGKALERIVATFRELARDPT